MEHLKELRKEKGLLQRDVADFLGVDRTTYVKYETGANEPDIEVIKKLADFFGVSTDYLLGKTVYFPNISHASASDTPDCLRISPEDQQALYRTMLKSIQEHGINSGIASIRAGVSPTLLGRLKDGRLIMVSRLELLYLAKFLELPDDALHQIETFPALEEKYAKFYRKLHDQVDRIDPDDVETVSEFLEFLAKKRKAQPRP